MTPQPQLPDSDPAHFLRIAGQGASLSSHADLWRWLQGDVQHLLAHEVMLIGWGDFRSGNLNFDIVSSLPGVRTHHCTTAMVAPLLSYLRDCWVAAQRTAFVLDVASFEELAQRQGSVVAGMRSAVVHGIGDGKRTSERIFAAFSVQQPPAANAVGALRLLTPYIDTALRQMAPAPQRQAAYTNDTVSRQVVKLLQLSERERQIMTWVAMGKTNPEIGCILSISEFTVKNHMKSIFGKLDVTNRAQAVAKLTRVDAYA